MFAAGSDTTVTTIEWAMPELLSGPGGLDRAQTEVTENQWGYDTREKQNDYNVWAISRDSQQGIDANSFQPEAPQLFHHSISVRLETGKWGKSRTV
ncbi:hypothetical protein POTOM_061452 [Populus tomentosa]|uniref:Uncharacterized protein n=1 Tax=Populus tomentosa TaxID=118781 RepID=A0A8X8C082_POPTO|nr:hypothetical protein POTOM_061452 [Populus tomentosa]